VAKKLTTLLSLCLMLVVTAVPAFALSVPGMSHHETGKIVSIDKNAQTFTVEKDRTLKHYTFEMKDPSSLVNLRVGEHVRVAYKKNGARLIANEVTERAEKTTASQK
jgi:hypothetical protein